MKLQLTIPERPKLMHFMPVMDIFAVVFAFPLLVFQFSSGGHKISTPTTTTRIPRVEHAIVIEVIAGDSPQIWINQAKTEHSEFDERLDSLASEWFYGGSPVVLLKLDENLTNGEAAELRNKLVAKSFSVWIAEELEE